MGLFGGDDDGGGFGNFGAAAGTMTGIGPVAGGAIGSAVGGMQGGGGFTGGINGISDWFAGKDPTQVGRSDFQAQNPLSNGFAQQLAYAQGNQNNANFAAYAPGANGQSFVQSLAGNYQNAQNQQNQLINNLQQQAAGQGPGAQLSNNFMNQAMNQNASNAMGLAASQKGINPAMAARLAGQNASQMNAQSAGQAANLNLQQQLAAQQQLGSALHQNQAMNLGGFQGFNQMANQQALGAEQLGVQAGLGTQGINAQTAAANAANKTKGLGGLLGGAGGILGGIAAFAAHGGQIPYVAGGDVPVMLSPGEKVLPKEIAHDEGAAEDFIESGKGKVPGKAKYEGDDIKNDTFKTKLASGDVVIPREAAKDDEKAKRFLKALGSWRKK